MAADLPFPDRFRALSDAYHQHGAADMLFNDRLELAKLLIQEERKGAFTIPDGNDSVILSTWMRHFDTEFVNTEENLVVIDYQERLLVHARALVAEPHPIVALLLYAAWAEHWLNGVLLTRLLKQGHSYAAACQRLKAMVPVKLDTIWGELSLPPLDDEHDSRLRALFRCRNNFVHYKWEPLHHEQAQDGDPTMREALGQIEDTVAYCHDYSLRVLSASALDVAERIFQVHPLRQHFLDQYRLA